MLERDHCFSMFSIIGLCASPEVFFRQGGLLKFFLVNEVTINGSLLFLDQVLAQYIYTLLSMGSNLNKVPT